MKLSAVQRKFIVHWGEMGTRWGVNRTVAQVHALLYIWPTPLNAEQITEALGVARSNVSTSLRELQNWGIVKVTQVLGDRRDYFHTLDDVWEMFQIILDERKKREVDPTLELLQQCMDELDKQRRPDEHTHERLKSLLDFFRTTTRWYEQIRALPAGTRTRFIKAGSRLQKMLER